MMKKIISILLLAVVTSFTFSSCEDMLTGEMDRNVEADELASDTLYAYWGILRGLQDIAERYVILGECRGDLVDGTQFIQDSINAILNFDPNAVDGSDAYHQISDYYKVINSCNAYLAKCDLGKVNAQSQSLMLKEYAQIASIRAWVYMQLVLAYGRVPYFEQPMLSTAAMSDFRSAPAYVDANSLAFSGAVQLLEQYRSVQAPYSEANSGNYITANASTCIFPQNLVLADIYLLGGQYEDAARHYYDYLNTEKGGALNQFYGTGHSYNTYSVLFKNESTNEYASYFSNYINMFKSGSYSVNNMDEVVTIIPSSNNRLYGRVLNDINRLFGFDATLSMRTSGDDDDATTTATVYLERNYEHQLGSSKAYETLCKDQDYETYIGPDGTTAVCTVQANAGDARFYDVTRDFTDTKTGAIEPIKFVMKQNPNGAFTTYYPIIYRKGNIWLRFAAALNGAGFPGYAFAILRHGLCGNPEWLPTEEADFYPDIKTYSHAGVSLPIWAIEYWDDTETVGEDKVIYDNMFSFFYHVYQRAINEGYTFTSTIAPADYDEFFDVFIKGFFDGTTYPEEKAFWDELYGNHLSGTKGLLYINYTGQGYEYGYKVKEGGDLHCRTTDYGELVFNTNVVCNYITKSEMLKAQTKPWLNFTTRYLQGSLTYNYIYTYWGPTEFTTYSTAKWTLNDSYLSMGIHERGCGKLKVYESNKVSGVDGGTTYNFFNQINKMLNKYEGDATGMTYDEIYSNNAADRQKVQIAIADLIQEEMALETCFEGNRFFDLLCYSRFLNNMGKPGTNRVAKIIANRTGTLNAALYSRLQDQNNWYLPCP